MKDRGFIPCASRRLLSFSASPSLLLWPAVCPWSPGPGHWSLAPGSWTLIPGPCSSYLGLLALVKACRGLAGLVVGGRDSFADVVAQRKLTVSP